MVVKSTIHANYQNLTKAERRFADYATENWEVMLDSTLSNLAKNAQVGEATIVRFLEKCGFSSLQDFKFAIIRDLENAETKSEPADYIEQLFDTVETEINNTNIFLDRKKARAVAKLITNSKNLYFFGIGHSGIVAEMGAYRFMRLAKLTTAITDIHFQRIQAKICEKGDVIIAVSKSGSSPELNDAIKLAKSRNVTIVSVVSSVNTPLEKLSDYTFLATSVKEDASYNGSGIDCVITQLLVIDILASGYTHSNFEPITKRSAEMTELLANKKRSYFFE